MSTTSAAAPLDVTTPTVLVIMGVSGTGKSTVAGLLAGHLDWALQEGDDLHPKANVDKMARGVPLTDEDRWPWLDLIAGWIDDQIAAGESSVITCSALKRSYRDRLRRPNVIFVHLTGPSAVITARMAARADHFMPPALLQSQLDTLEVPGPDENVITVNLSASPRDEVAEVLHALGRP